jgi:hypothetical protein
LLMHTLVRQQLSSPMGVKRDEVQRWIVSLKDTLQSRRSIGHGFIVAALGASAETKLIGAWHKRLYNKIVNRSRGCAR